MPSQQLCSSHQPRCSLAPPDVDVHPGAQLLEYLQAVSDVGLQQCRRRGCFICRIMRGGLAAKISGAWVHAIWHAMGPLLTLRFASYSAEAPEQLALLSRSFSATMDMSLRTQQR